jgi:hypothetical protein
VTQNKKRKPIPRTGRPTKPYPDNPDSPLVWGAENIGKFINADERRVYHLHREGRIPVTQVGNLLVGKKSELADPTTWPGQDGAS